MDVLLGVDCVPVVPVDEPLVELPVEPAEPDEVEERPDLLDLDERLELELPADVAEPVVGEVLDVVVSVGDDVDPEPV